MCWNTHLTFWISTEYPEGLASLYIDWSAMLWIPGGNSQQQQQKADDQKPIELRDTIWSGKEKVEHISNVSA